MKLLHTETGGESLVQQLHVTIESLHDQSTSLQIDVDTAVQARETQVQVVRTMQDKMKTSAPSAEQNDKIESLEQVLEDKQMQMKSLEMQLLELEREREFSSQLRPGCEGAAAALPLATVPVTKCAADSTVHGPRPSI
jgi:predicted RNase H-like nuclease (RuvC/YqgF family)